MNIPIILNYQTEYRIVIPTEASAVEKTAAEELKVYLKKAFSVELPIEKEDGSNQKGFYIGHTRYASSQGISGKSKENWILKMADGSLILTGGVTACDRGIVYAVYHFLEDVVGVRWWTRFEEDVPRQSDLSLAPDFFKEGTPAFSYRKILSHKNIPDFYFEARNRDNVVMVDDAIPGGIFNENVVSLGGALHMGRPNHVHSLGLYFPATEYYDIHPEWFAWSESEQNRVTYGHYCLTNEEYISAMIEKLLGFIEEDRKIAAEKGVEMPVFYSVSFPDVSSGFCQCQSCQELLKQKGPSGYAITFVNRIARAVYKKYPDVKIETLVYSLYLDKPLDDTLPEKNMVIRLAQVFVDLIHELHHKGNAWYLQLLQDWSEICKKAGCDLYIWDYMYQLFFDLPAPVANRLGDTFRTFYDCGVKGIFVENQCYTADMWELNLYLLLHLSEDPYADTDALIDDFMTRFYGPASSFVKAYYEELVRASLENPYSIYCVIESVHFNYLDVPAFKKGMELLEKAMVAVSEDPVFRPRVQYLQTLLAASLGVKFYDVKRRAEELGESFDFDRRAVCQLAIEGFKAAENRPKPRTDLTRFASAVQYFESLTMEEDIAPLPQELSHVAPEDAYQFFFKNTCRHLCLNHVYGFSVADDPAASTGKAAKFSKDMITTIAEFIFLSATSRDAIGAKGVSLVIEQDAKIVDGIEIFREDIVPGTYQLFKIGSVFDIRDAADTRVDMFGNNFEWVSLSGISVLFPMDACDVYISIKFTGEPYGGDPLEEEAVYLDRVIVVRKKEQ